MNIEDFQKELEEVRNNQQVHGTISFIRGIIMKYKKNADLVRGFDEHAREMKKMIESGELVHPDWLKKYPDGYYEHCRAGPFTDTFKDTPLGILSEKSLEDLWIRFMEEREEHYNEDSMPLLEEALEEGYDALIQRFINWVITGKILFACPELSNKYHD